MKHFFKGFINIFNIWPSSPSEEVKKILSKSPKEALQEDWKAVGDDFRTALSYFPVSRKKKS